MTVKNRGNSSLRRKRRVENPMEEFDRLPAVLRTWLSTAILPWRAKSVRRAYDRALANCGNPEAALARLDEIEGHRIAQDARRVWGPDHPFTAPCGMAGGAISSAAQKSVRQPVTVSRM